MANLIINIFYVLLALIIVVFLDFRYFKNDFQKILTTNILIFIVFAAVYYIFLSNL